MEVSSRGMRRSCSLLLLLVQSACLGARPPHIILIYADDLGWNDVSFHGSPQIPTPNIDALALNGIILNNYYGEWLCTPSRAALMTGKYPIRLGLQHFVIKAGEDTSLPLDEITLPQRLKKLGYDTHMIGKWHLGAARNEYTPTFRGFDTYFGYLNGALDYYDYTGYYLSQMKEPEYFYGIDLYNGTTPVKNFREKYATYAFADRAIETISNHNTSKPLFLYLAHLAVHKANKYQYLQAPVEIISKFKYIKDIDRRIFAAVVSVLDETVGTVFKALQDKDMLENSIVVFVSDNGGDVEPLAGGLASNYPLRGKKMTNWEGGIRVPAIIWSPLLKLNEPRISKQLMHVSDWLPTLYSAAGGNLQDLGTIDGHSMWQALTDDVPSPRLNVLNTLDPVYGLSAYRSQDLKVLNGSIDHDIFMDWYGPSGFADIDKPPSMYKWVFKDEHMVMDILMDSGMWIVKDPDYVYDHSRVICERPPPISAGLCAPRKKPCLFNISADPCEYSDLSDKYPELVTEMMNVIFDYQEASMPPQSKDIDPRADPACHDFTFVPWLDPEHDTKCDYTQH